MNTTDLEWWEWILENTASTCNFQEAEFLFIYFKDIIIICRWKTLKNLFPGYK